MLKTTLSKCQLIKISMTYVYRKPEVKKNDTTAMTTITNEAYIEKLHENCYFMGK